MSEHPPRSVTVTKNLLANSTSKTTLPVIRLERIRHRDGSRIALRFAYNVQVKDFIKQLDMVRWTQTHRCFYIDDNRQKLARLVEHCRGKIWVDFKAIQREATHSTQISAEVLQKIDEMEDWMRQKRYSLATIKTYLSFVRQFFAGHRQLQWNEIDPSHITKYNYEYFIKGKKSYSAQNQWINAIKLYLQVHGLNRGDLSEIERPRKQNYLPDVLSQEEVKLIFSKTGNLKHRTLLMLVYSCGLRIGEALALSVHDIRSGEGLIYIRSGKGGNDRRVPLSPRILEQLRQYYETYVPTTYLFEGQRGGRYSTRSAAAVLKRAVQKAGIKKRVTLHTLRHSYATHLTNRGVNIQYLQEILGHKSPKTTMIYTHLSGKDIRDVRSPLDDMEI